MGALSTKASLAGCTAPHRTAPHRTARQVSLVVFGSEPDKDRKNKTIGNLAVKAVAWDTTLGGAAFTSKLCAPRAHPIGPKSRLLWLGSS
jgi:hypothetical protein